MREGPIERHLCNLVSKAGGRAYKWVSPGNKAWDARSGFPEILAEVPQISGLTFDQFNTIMQTRPKWATGFPLEAKGYEGTRYEKR